MNEKNEKFERIRLLLSNYPSHYCLIYRGKESRAGVELKWCKAASSDQKNREDYDSLASKHNEIALNAFKNKRDYLLKENPRRANSKVQKWCGIEVLTQKKTKETFDSADSGGPRWWQLVIGSGTTRDAGYVIVTRISVKETTELQDCIAKIQDIMA